MGEERDSVSVDIDNTLSSLSSTPTNPSIFRVRDNVRSHDEKLYDPEIISIGPLHHGSKDHFKKMEEQKLRYLKDLLNRTKESNTNRYIMELRVLEEKARECYAEPFQYSSDDFVKMLFLDGCFIIELIRKSKFIGLREMNDTIFENEQVLSQLRHDLILIENQIPFFVLNKLSSMTTDGKPNDDLQGLFRDFIFNYSTPPSQPEPFLFENIDHLLGLVHKILCSRISETTNGIGETQRTNLLVEKIKHLLGLLVQKLFCSSSSNNIVETRTKMVTINCATELQEAGVKFQKFTEELFLKIGFIDGVLKMPGFYIYDGTESFLRNVMAYERYFTKDQPKYFTDYAFLMQCLINSRKDVQILRCAEIITNYLGDDDMVCSLFNRFGKNITTPSHFYYGDIFEQVNVRYRSQARRWTATLRNNYFNGPWKTIAILASVILLLLTIIQTIILGISYKKL